MKTQYLLAGGMAAIALGWAAPSSAQQQPAAAPQPAPSQTMQPPSPAHVPTADQPQQAPTPGAPATPPPASAPGYALQPQQSAPAPVPVVIVQPEEPRYSNRISFGPLGLMFGIGNLTYERALADHLSVEASPLFFYWGFDDDDLYGGGLGLGASIYPMGKALKGMKISLTAGPGFITYEDDYDSDTAFIFASKLLFGYQWIWSSGFSMGIGGGTQYVHISGENDDIIFNGILPAVDFNLGFAF